MLRLTFHAGNIPVIALSVQSLLCGDADNAQAVAAASSTSLTNSIKVAVAKAQASATAANGKLSSQALSAFCLPACLILTVEGHWNAGSR